MLFKLMGLFTFYNFESSVKLVLFSPVARFRANSMKGRTNANETYNG
jgi:hypothetical protein